MFSSKNIYHYLIVFSVIFISSQIANKLKMNFENNDEHFLIKKYLLNDSPLYAYNKPKLWIHTKYEINSRKWQSFHSRNNNHLNQPYINLTLKSIINHCGNDFNICLIDDDSFNKLIPSWDVNVSSIAEPIQSHVRQIGLLQILHYYGGLIVPNSFICMKNLIDLYNEGIDHPFINENPERPLFYGSEKNNSSIYSLIQKLNGMNDKHFTLENHFTKIMEKHAIDEKWKIIRGDKFGLKTKWGKPILLDDLMEETQLDVSPDLYGLYIPYDELLKRIKYQWFSVMNEQDILKSNVALSKYIKNALADGVSKRETYSEAHIL